MEAQGLLGGFLTERKRKELRLARSLEERHIEATRPGEVIQIDTFYIGKLKGVGKVWQYAACDAYGSYGLARLTSGEVNAADAAAFLREVVVPAYKRAGHVIRRVTVDGRSEFKGLFRLACEEPGIERYRVGPHRPWTNGFVERLQGTILTELWRPALTRTYFVRLEDMQYALDAYLRYYNHDRPHQGYRLHGRTPAELFGSPAS